MWLMLLMPGRGGAVPAVAPGEFFGEAGVTAAAQAGDSGDPWYKPYL